MRQLASGVLILTVCSVLVPPSAWAGKKPKKHSEADVVVIFEPEARSRVQSYFVEAHGRGKCPPGLAKKNNGCLPPGQAKKRYVVGRPLAPAVVIEPLPVELSVRIGPPPHGYRYGVVDGDVLKLAVGTALVVDAIQGLVE
jgi:hypothetical protein